MWLLFVDVVWLLMVSVKVKLSLCLINLALYHQNIGGSGGIAPPSLTSALDGGEWSIGASNSDNMKGLMIRR
jgi:hypothetical protein